MSFICCSKLSAPAAAARAPRALPGPACGSLVVFAGQGVGNHTHQLLPGSLAVGSEVLAEVGGHDDDQDVTQELWGQEQPQVRDAPNVPTRALTLHPGKTWNLKNLPQVLFKIHLKLGLCSYSKGSASVWEE